MAVENRTIGIDLGTTKSCVAVWKVDSGVEVIVNGHGKKTTPSVVAFTEDNERLVGSEAFNQMMTNTANSIFDSKRLIGRRFTDDCVQKDMKHWPFKVIEGRGEKPNIVVTYEGQKKKYAPEDISAMILTKMREIAENHLESSVTDAVITVPAYFNNAQREATKRAGVSAGLNVKHIINEPTAAAIAYGLHKNVSRNSKRNVFIYDLGGGTLDVSLLSIVDNVFKVMATAGDTHLGGEDIDSRMVDYCVQQFKRDHNVDVGEIPSIVRRLRNHCEEAKTQLSFASSVTLGVPSLYKDVDFKLKLTREKFEEINGDLFIKCMDVVEKCLRDAKMDANEVDDVVLVGGSSRIPKVQQLLQTLFNGKDLCKSINPDEAVAIGAAVQAAALSGVNLTGRFQDFNLLDVTRLSLGMKVHQTSLMSVVIPRNSPIPTTQSQTYGTFTDNQTGAHFCLYEGESKHTADNYFLGDFTIHDIPRAPAGEVKFDVCFDIDVNGILSVSAVDKTTGQKKGITINYDGKVSTSDPTSVETLNFREFVYSLSQRRNRSNIWE